MIDMARAHALGKAARVIIDEAKMVGLRGDLEVNAKQQVRDFGTSRTYNYRTNVTVTGGESPPKAS